MNIQEKKCDRCETKFFHQENAKVKLKEDSYRVAYKRDPDWDGNWSEYMNSLCYTQRSHHQNKHTTKTAKRLCEPCGELVARLIEEPGTTVISVERLSELTALEKESQELVEEIK